MRGFLVLLLGAAVLYLAWDKFAGEPGAAGEPDVAPATGRMMSVAELEAKVGEEAAASVGEPQGPGSAPGAEAGQARARALGLGLAGPGAGAKPALGLLDETPSAARAGQTALAGALPLDWTLGDPVAEGSLLLHDAGGLPGYLDGPGRDLSEARKRLLFACALLIRRQPEQARRYAEGLQQAVDVTAAERDLLFGMLDEGRARPRAASSANANALVLGVRMALLSNEAEDLLAAGRHREAADVLSALLLREIEAPWIEERELLAAWARKLHEAQAGHRWNKKGVWPSFEVTVEHGDSLVAIRKRILAERPRMVLCTGLIQRSNQLGRYLHEGDVLRVPTDAAHALVDLSSRRVFYLLGEEVAASWEIAVGREGKTTPGIYTVGEKLDDPPWFRPGREPVPFGHPDNPLGTRWIAWAESDGLGFHGTWEPETIGTEASDGCVRLSNEDIEELFEILPRGARVVVQP